MLLFLQLRELAKSNPDQKAEINALKSENARLKQNSDGLRDQLAQLQSKVSFDRNVKQMNFRSIKRLAINFASQNSTSE